MEQYEFELNTLLHKLPTEELFNKQFSDMADKKEDSLINFYRIAEFWLKESDKATQFSEKLHSYPEYIDFTKKQAEYEKLKAQYYIKLYLYWKMINEDRKLQNKK